MIKLFTALLLTIVLTMSVVYATNAQAKSSFEEHKAIQVPNDIPIFDQASEKHYLEEYEGKTLLIVFWASWSSPCIQDMIDLDILQKDFRKLPFEILPISEDDQGVKVIENFYKIHEIRHLPILHDYRNQLFKSFGVVGMPTSFLVTPEGMNIGSFKGIVHWHDDDIRKILLSHITGNPTEPRNSYKTQSLNQIIQKPAETKPNEQNQESKK